METLRAPGGTLYTLSTCVERSSTPHARSVWFGEDAHGTSVVLKLALATNSHAQRRFRDELAVYRAVRHEGVPRLLHVHRGAVLGGRRFSVLVLERAGRDLSRDAQLEAAREAVDHLPYLVRRSTAADDVIGLAYMMIRWSRKDGRLPWEGAYKRSAHIACKRRSVEKLCHGIDPRFAAFLRLIDADAEPPYEELFRVLKG